MKLDRRRILSGAVVGLGAGALALPAFASSRARSETVGELKVFRLPVNRRGDWLILQLRSRRGLIGLGDASHGGKDDATIGYLKRFADLLRDRSIFDVEWFRQASAPIRREGGKPAEVAASALEQCLWDLMGRSLDVPSYDLLGGKLRDRIALYANINRSTNPRTADAFAAMAGRAVEEGFDAVKLAPFDEMPADVSRTTNVTPLIEQGIARAQAVRDAIGTKRKLLIDAHSRFTRAEGLELARRFEPLDLYWLEEVTLAEPIEDLVAINRAAKMPTAGGESIPGITGFYPYVRAGAVDIPMPDVKICGGMLELKKIAGLAEAAGLPVSPHGPASPIGNLAAAQVVATLPNFTILEFAFAEVPWRAELLSPNEAVTRGELILSSKPGFGHALDLRAVDRRGAAV